MKQECTRQQGPGPERGCCCHPPPVSLKAGRFRLDREELLRSRRATGGRSGCGMRSCPCWGLTVLAAPMLILAVVIWVDSPGASPIFVQNRVGLNGTMFRMYKFRSMIPRAEEGLGALLGQNEMAGPVFKMKGDPRITRVGRLLRRTGLDEFAPARQCPERGLSLWGPARPCRGRRPPTAPTSNSASMCCRDSPATGRSSPAATKWPLMNGRSGSSAHTGPELLAGLEIDDSNHSAVLGMYGE